MSGIVYETLANMTKVYQSRSKAKVEDLQWITNIGSARLLRQEDGQLVLMGGSRSDFLAAKEWVSLFVPEGVLMDPENHGWCSRYQVPGPEMGFVTVK